MAARIQQTEFEKAGDAAPARRTRTAAISECTRGHNLRAWIVSDCSTFLPPFTAGGTERQLSDLARQLELCGVEVTLVVRESPNWPAGALPAEDGLRTQFVPPAPIPKGMGWAALAPNIRYITGTFQRLLRARREYDVLIVSGFKQLGLPIALLARLVGKPCLVRIDAAWDLDDELTPESTARIGWQARRLTSAAIRASRRGAFQLAHGVVAFSDPLEHRLLALGAAPRKIKRIPNGIDTERFAPAAREKKVALRRALGLPTDRAIFIYTGRICRAKGLLELMSVWQRLADRRDVYLLLVGSGAHTHESCEIDVRAVLERHSDSIGWCGAVENVADYLQAADVFISLSYFEAFGLSIVEAAAAGLPCIVSDVGCARQAVRHRESGAIVPPYAAPDAILREIEWMLAHRGQWAEMGALGRANVVEVFDMRTVARRYLELFDTLGAGRRPRPSGTA